MSFEVIEKETPRAKICVIGIGGGGGNAINNMISSGMTGVDFISINTDIKSLEQSLAPTRYQLGRDLTDGLGTGAKPKLGEEAANNDRDNLIELLMGNDMVFITAGMGGGTGTGAAPIIAQVAKELGILTVGVVTRPFLFEGNRRRKVAEQGIQALEDRVDTLITIPNQRLISISDKNTKMIDIFKMADNVLSEAVRGISDLINSYGYIAVDFADVRTIMENKGQGLMGQGFGKGRRGIVEATQQAISSPLLDEVSINGAQSVLINITASSDLPIQMMSEATNLIAEEAHEDANIIFGVVTDETLGDQVRVTVIATEFDTHQQQQPAVDVRVANSLESNSLGGMRSTKRSYPPLTSGLDDTGYDLPTFYKR